VEKNANSPLITFTLYDGTDQVIQLPENSYIQLVYEHDVVAKYPPVRNIYRWLDEGETPSTVMGSSLCSYLLLNQTNSIIVIICRRFGNGTIRAAGLHRATEPTLFAIVIISLVLPTLWIFIIILYAIYYICILHYHVFYFKFLNSRARPKH